MRGKREREREREGTRISGKFIRDRRREGKSRIRVYTALQYGILERRGERDRV